MYEILANHQAHTNAFTVHLGGVFQLAEELKQFAHVLLANAFASVDDVNVKFQFTVIECHQNAHGALIGELEGVLDKVYQDLLQSKAVSFKILGQIFQLEQLLRVVKNVGRLEAKDGDCVAANLAVLYFSLRPEHIFDERESFRGLKDAKLRFELAHLYEFHIQDIVDEAEKEVEL